MRALLDKVTKDHVFRVFRLLFFGLLAFDEFLAASRPADPSALLISKVPLVFEDTLDWVPTPILLSRAHTVACVASLVAALAPYRWYKKSAVIAAVLYNFAYWSNALDRFQHHFLLCMLLVLLPWAHDHSWVRRLVVVQLAIVYFWTAVAKLADDGLFLGGDFVRMAARRREVFDAVHYMASMVGLEDGTVWSIFAANIVGVELLLVVLLLTERVPWLAIFVGVSMHLGIEFVGKLSIGRFSWFMMSLYILLIPAQ